jgi:hypothetical protein
MSDTPDRPGSSAPARVDELRALLAAATPLPWRMHDTDLAIGGHTATILADDPARNPSLIAWLPTFSGKPFDTERNCWNDAALIAAAVNALPGLIAENERLTRELAALKQLAADAGFQEQWAVIFNGAPFQGSNGGWTETDARAFAHLDRDIPDLPVIHRVVTPWVQVDGEPFAGVTAGHYCDGKGCIFDGERNWCDGGCPKPPAAAGVAQTPTGDCGPTHPLYPHGCQQPDSARQTDRPGERWSNLDPPGGWVCATHGTPTESEPCDECPPDRMAHTPDGEATP